ncbi:MAG: DMT family transporter [Chloroflexota bacterium]|nr:DMT family transporter [Chloroflexota bacterium]
MAEVKFAEELKQAPKSTFLRSHQLKYDGLLVLVTLIWGSTFLVVKETLKLTGPFTYLALSYSVGTLALALIFHKRLLRITHLEVKSGLTIGIFLFAGYALQTTGIQYTTVSKAGFITGMYVPLVPLFSFLFLRQRPTLKALVGVALSVIGLCLLSLNNQFNLEFGVGEALILGCALAYAMHIIMISKFAPSADAINLAIVQLALTSVLSFLVIPIAREPFVLPPLPVWGAVLFMGMADVAFTLLAMNWVQQFVSGTRATLVYALEPMWAALTGYLLAGDVLSLPAWFGCGCILLGMIVGVFRVPFLKKKPFSSGLLPD